MDKATQTMIENLHKNTGKPLEQWIAIVKKEKTICNTSASDKVSL